MERTGALSRKAEIMVRARMLILIVPLIALELAALTGPRIRLGQFLLGIALWFGATVLTSALTLLLGIALGARVLWLNIGVGPRLSRRVIGDHVRVLRAVPIGFGGGVLPKRNVARVWRLFTGSYLTLPVVFSAVAAPFLPAWSALSIGLMTAVYVILAATNRDPGSGRLILSRVLVTPREHTDPALVRADRIAANWASIDAAFGDFDQAETVLTQLRATPGAEMSVALLSAELFAARGEYDKALRVPFPQPDPADASKLTEALTAMHSAQAAKLMLLAAEQDPQLTEKALSMAQSHLRSVAASRTALPSDRMGRALFALAQGDVRAAAQANRICMSRARTPLTLVDALCTGARIEAARGHRAKAVKHIDEAARLAPWYPRVMTVRQILGAEAATIKPRQLSAVAGTDTTHVFAEPWSVAGSAPEDG